MNQPIRFHPHAGDWVVVRPLDEILSTLDADGCLEGMPFMPEMAGYCGRQMRVFRRAHKTCDTVEGLGGRSVNGGGIHLEGARCSGSAHGGCHNSCMVFWKEAWLDRVDGTHTHDAESTLTAAAAEAQPDPVVDARLPRRWLYNVGPEVPHAEIRWRCQATEAPKFTAPLSPFSLSQYLEDVSSRNIDLRELLAGAAHAVYRKLVHIGIGYRVVVAVHDAFQRRRGGISNPYINGKLTKTPVETLDLQVGERVRIKPFEQIMATLDTNNKNRGLWFVPQEMGRFCGREARVAKRVSRLISERSGQMLEMKTPAVVLEGIACTGRTIEKRMFCPRASALYWREIWLERVEKQPPTPPCS